MSREARPLGSAALILAALGILPWATAGLMLPSGATGTVMLFLEAATLLAVAASVRLRAPVRRPRLGLAAATLLLLCSIVRFGVVPLAARAWLGSQPVGAESAALQQLLGWLSLLGVAFMGCCLVLLLVCVPGLVRQWRQS